VARPGTTSGRKGAWRVQTRGLPCQGKPRRAGNPAPRFGWQPNPPCKARLVEAWDGLPGHPWHGLPGQAFAGLAARRHGLAGSQTHDVWPNSGSRQGVHRPGGDHQILSATAFAYSTPFLPIQIGDEPEFGHLRSPNSDLRSPIPPHLPSSIFRPRLRSLLSALLCPARNTNSEHDLRSPASPACRHARFCPQNLRFPFVSAGPVWYDRSAGFAHGSRWPEGFL
jgi:hypothetical protein